MTADANDYPAMPIWLLFASALSMLAALYMIFVWVSTEVTMGIIQRIFYFHVSAASAAFWGAFVGGIASLLYLKTQNPAHDDLAVAANESVLVFSAINIIMGSMWGRRSWGIWWTWDARLTSSLLLVLIYVAYITVRKAAPVERRGVIGSVICLFGMADVPMIYMSNRLFRTQHPAPVIGADDESGLDPDMLFTLLFAHVAMLLFWWCVVRVRRRVAQLERKLEFLPHKAHETLDRTSSFL
jgi:heme exporter protein C